MIFLTSIWERKKEKNVGGFFFLFVRHFRNVRIRSPNRTDRFDCVIIIVSNTDSSLYSFFIVHQFLLSLLSPSLYFLSSLLLFSFSVYWKNKHYFSFFCLIIGKEKFSDIQLFFQRSWQWFIDCSYLIFRHRRGYRWWNCCSTLLYFFFFLGYLMMFRRCVILVLCLSICRLSLLPLNGYKCLLVFTHNLSSLPLYFTLPILIVHIFQSFFFLCFFFATVYFIVSFSFLFFFFCLLTLFFCSLAFFLEELFIDSENVWSCFCCFTVYLIKLI